MSFFEDTKKFIDFDTLSYLVKKLRDENQSTYLNSSDLAANEDIDYIFQKIESKNYLTIEALEDGLTASLSVNACEYCIDESGDWKTLSVNTPTESINAGQTLSFRGNLIPTVDDNLEIYGIGTFTISKKCNVLGNVMSMLFGDDGKNRLSLNGKDYSFYKLFQGCTNIISAKDLILPATTLSYDCYRGMFQNCTSLVNTPALPATTLTDNCYYSMFNGCSSLTTAPELPAINLAKTCYTNMFKDCTSLISAPKIILKDVQLKAGSAGQMFYGCSSLIDVSNIILSDKLDSQCYMNLFKNCTSLTTAPELPATTLADKCYTQMFSGCTSLTQAPELPATMLADGCYQAMFINCTSLTTAPELPVTTLADNCYRAMFKGCTSLTTAPELPVTTLADNCYREMFDGCTSLTTAPELPATIMKDHCYYGMFEGCTSLVNTPELPEVEAWSTSGFHDWAYMFGGCTSLTKAPVLKTKILGDRCYRGMFENCTKLTHIEMHATDISANKCLTLFLKNASPTGTIYIPKGVTLPIATSSNEYNGIPEGWTVQDITPEPKKYLTIEALEDGLTAKLSVNACEYCVDEDGDWKTLSADTPTESINAGQTLSFRGNLTPNSTSGIGTFTITRNCNVLGNVMSMLFGDDGKNSLSLSGKNYSFYKLFSNCANIISAKDLYLPATELADWCYAFMFQGCTSLTTAPELSATTLADSCYYSMFYNCTSLTTAPELPATTLVQACYSSMFYNCTSLTTAPELPATTLKSNCYNSMFCNCTSLTTAPELPATTLADFCYNNMFNGCKKLNKITMLATDISATICLNNWVNGVASTGTFIKHPDMTSLPTGASGIPEGWTVQDAA